MLTKSQVSEMGGQIHNIKIPLAIFNENGHYSLIPLDETESIIGDCPFCAQGESIEEAEKDLFRFLKWHNDYLQDRSRQLDRWHPFRKGRWFTTGGTWFTCFGVGLYFRYGKSMHFGWYVPFTKLNVSIINYWMVKKA